jgi:hypothetical protein
LLVSIPDSGDRLLPRKIALRDVLGSLDHPVVVSASDVFASRGQTFNHQLRVLSKAGRLTFSLVKGSAPGTLRVGEDGLVTWPLPSKFSSKDVRLIIKVKDATGREVSHRLAILVR